MTKTCWKWDRMFFGLNGCAPGSWKTIVTISFPICRFLRSFNKKKMHRLKHSLFTIFNFFSPHYYKLLLFISFIPNDTSSWKRKQLRIYMTSTRILVIPLINFRHGHFNFHNILISTCYIQEDLIRENFKLNKAKKQQQNLLVSE